MMAEKSGELPSIEHRPTKEQIEKSIRKNIEYIDIFTSLPVIMY